MTGPIWFEFLLAAIGAGSVAIALRTGRLDLDRGPEAYRQATRTTDPGRYWAFIAGASIVTLAMFVEAIYRSVA